MTSKPQILVVDPAHFDVSYTINPWMQPSAWALDPGGCHARAVLASTALRQALRQADCEVLLAPGSVGLPDMVFPANAAVVLDRRALTSRFRYPERQGEEAAFLAIFEGLRERGLLDEVAQMPAGIHQEGAGDCIWDATRGHFWVGYGPRSRRESVEVLANYFGQPAVALELRSERCYHLDVCFCPLAGGEVLVYMPALSDAAQRTLRERVPTDLLIEATEDDLQHFSVNAVSVGRHVVMSHTTARLRALLSARGYTVVEIDLSPFMMSGGGSYCMTLRLDRVSGAVGPAAGAELVRPANQTVIA